MQNPRGALLSQCIVGFLRDLKAKSTLEGGVFALQSLTFGCGSLTTVGQAGNKRLLRLWDPVK